MPNTTQSTKERVYLVRDNSGNYHQMERKRCGHCSQELQIGEEYHVECLRNFRERENVMLQKRREESSIAKYGSVISETQQWARDHPNHIAMGLTESYNQRLDRLEEQKKQEYYAKCAAREERKRRLPNLEYQLKFLKKQIEQDEAEDEEEQLKVQQEMTI